LSIGNGSQTFCGSPKPPVDPQTDEKALATNLWKECLWVQEAEQAALGSEGWVGEKEEGKENVPGCGNAEMLHQAKK
jgi:hypothetical protein